MKVKYLDRRIENFRFFSILIVLIFTLLIALFVYIYKYFTLDIYNGILVVLILLSGTIVIIVVFAMLAIIHAYRAKSISKALLLPVKLGIKMIIPFTIFITGLFGYEKDAIRALFIDINNIFVQSGKYTYKPEKILILLPHCLQNSECGYKITSDINNCRQCGRCSIGAIVHMADEKCIKLKVVTGGTAARNLVGNERPGVILSVACERELSAGIAEIRRIPVVGIVNQRPNGPCLNTFVDVELFRQKLEDLLKYEYES